MERASRARSLVPRVLLSVASALLCLGLVEGWLALQHRRDQAALERRYEGRRRCSTRSEHAELIYTRIPGRCGTNSRGYRDREHGLRKPAHGFRLVVIGDSVAQGQGVPLRLGFGRVLERMLRERAGAGGVEVVTLARSGYSTSQQLFLLENEAFAYQPDLLVWSYVLNDPAHPVHHDANGELGRFFHEPRLHTAHFVASRLFGLRERRWRGRCPEEFHAFLHCAYREQVRARILRIGELTRARDVPVVFLIHPVFEEHRDYGAYSLSAVHAQLAADATEAGLEVLDLLDAFAPYRPDELRQSHDARHDPWHPNPLGHRLAAESLYARIEAGRPFRTWLEAGAGR